MLVALAGILIGFHIMSGGKLIQPANMVTLVVQASGVAIMATGMVLIIVSRNIDLSVGSIVGVVAMSYALLMTDWLPALGLGLDSPFQWLVALAIGLGIGALIGGFQGFLIAYVGIPSFIVTLGGLLSLRGSVWLLSSGAAVSGLQSEFRKIGGGVLGSIGETATWVVAGVACLAIIGLIVVQPSAATALRLPRAAHVGRGAARRDRLRGRDRPVGVCQFELPASRPRDAVRGRSTESPSHPAA